MKKDFLKDSKKIKEYEKDGDIYEVWSKKGLTDNQVTTLKKNDELVKIDQGGNDVMNFDRDSFDIYFDDSVFDLPKECS